MVRGWEIIGAVLKKDISRRKIIESASGSDNSDLKIIEADLGFDHSAKPGSKINA